MKVLFAAILLVVSFSASAQEISIVCKYERTIDDAGKSSPTTGEFSVNVAYMLPSGKPKNLRIRTTKAPCFEFLGDGDDMKIEGSCVRYIENGNAPKLKMTTMLAIDRLSGAFEQIVQFNDKGGLVHNGHCAAVSKRF